MAFTDIFSVRTRTPVSSWQLTTSPSPSSSVSARRSRRASSVRFSPRLASSRYESVARAHTSRGPTRLHQPNHPTPPARAHPILHTKQHRASLRSGPPCGVRHPGRTVAGIVIDKCAGGDDIGPDLASGEDDQGYAPADLVRGDIGWTGSGRRWRHLPLCGAWILRHVIVVIEADPSSTTTRMICGKTQRTCGRAASALLRQSCASSSSPRDRCCDLMQYRHVLTVGSSSWALPSCVCHTLRPSGV